MDDLAALLAASYPTAYRTACLVLRDPVEAEDAVQEAFLRVWRFRASLPADPESAKPWLYRVVVNACLSRRRAEKPHRDRVTELDEARLARDTGPGPDELAIASDVGRAVSRALAALPEHLRVPVVLRYYAGLSEKEIATAIDRRPGTVKSRLHEARARLAADPAVQALHADARDTAADGAN